MGTHNHPQWNDTARFTIGRDHHGWWVVNDRLGRVGGVFASEDAAAHFAAEVADHDDAKIRHASVDEEIELFGEQAETGTIGQRVLEHDRQLRRA